MVGLGATKLVQRPNLQRSLRGGIGARLWGRLFGERYEAALDEGDRGKWSGASPQYFIAPSDKAATPLHIPEMK